MFKAVRVNANETNLNFYLFLYIYIYLSLCGEEILSDKSHIYSLNTFFFFNLELAILNI